MSNVYKLLQAYILISIIPIGLIAQEEHKLDTITIQKPISPIEHTVDKLLYHVDRDKNLRGKTAEDIFKRLPMVAVSYDDQISLRGDRNIKILINGKPWSGAANNIGTALRMLSSDQIKTIEIMTAPSLKHDAEGSGGIINIVTKKPKTHGASGSFSTNIGTRQSNSNLNIIGKTGKWNISSGAGTSWSWPINSVITSQLWKPDGTPVYDQVNHSRNRRRGIQLNTTINYEIDSTTSLMSMVNINQMYINTDNHIVNQYASDRTIRGVVENKQPNRNFDIGLDYTKYLGSNEDELAIAVQYMKTQNDTEYNSSYDSHPQTTELGRITGDNQEFTFQIDYQKKIKQTKLNIGGKTINRQIKSMLSLDTLSLDQYHADKNKESDTFNYQQAVLAVYATASLPVGKRIQVNSGIRYEKTILKSNPYQNLFPYVALALSEEDGKSYTLRYGQRIQRPSLYFLNPYLNTSDKINQVQGNPALHAEICHNFDLERSFSLNKFNTLINTSLYYKKTNNIIEPLLHNIAENGEYITLQSFENIGSSTQMGINLYSSITLIKVISLRVNLDLFTYRISPYSIFRDQTDQAHKTFLNHKLFAAMDLDLGKNMVLESSLFFDSPQKTFHGAYAAFNMWNLALKKKMIKESLTIGVSIIDPFSRAKNLQSYSSSPIFYQQNNFKLPFRSFGCSISWNFGNHKTNLSKRRTTKILNEDQKKQTH